jgi:hypoxia up-regulated 1
VKRITNYYFPFEFETIEGRGVVGLVHERGALIEDDEPAAVVDVEVAEPAADAETTNGDDANVDKKDGDAADADAEKKEGDNADKDADKDDAETATKKVSTSRKEKAPPTPVDIVYSAEELVAMTLQDAIRLASDEAGMPVKDVVLTVPVFFSQKQRQALLDAAEIAGLNVLSLINENTAAAVQFGIDLDYNVNTTKTVIFYNMGASSTQVNLVKYSAYVEQKTKKTNKTIGQFEVLGHDWDTTLGGLAFDQILTEMMADKLQEQLVAAKMDTDVRTIPKVMAKLKKYAEKAKKTLSANDKCPVNIESIYKDLDFRFLITREDFIQAAEKAGLFDRVKPLVESVLAKSGLNAEDVDELIIIGGGLRIPKIQTLLKEAMKGQDLGLSLNGDEAMALGAAFGAANLSTQFRVRRLGMVDVTPYPVGVELVDLPGAELADDEKPFDKKTGIFKANNRIATRKTVAVSLGRSIQAKLNYKNAEGLPVNTDNNLRVFNVTGIEKVIGDEKNAKLLEEQSPRVSLSFVLGNSGLINLAKAEATLEEMVQVPIEKPKKEEKKSEKKKKRSKKDDEKKEGDDAEKKEGDDAEKKEADDAAKQTEDAEKSEEASTESATEAETGTEKPTEAEKVAETDAADAEDKSTTEAEAEKTEGSDDAETKEGGDEEKKPEEEVIEYETKKKVHRFPLKISRGFTTGSLRAMGHSSKKAGVKTLLRLNKKDQRMKDIAQAKNDLESFVYATRSRMSDEDVGEVSNEEQREAVKAKLMEAEDWLYDTDDVEGAPKKFINRLADLQELSDPIFFRVKQVTARVKAVNKFNDLVNLTRNLIPVLEANHTWVPVEDRERLSEMIDVAEKWLAEKTTAQDALASHETPAYTSKEVFAELAPIAKLAQELQNRKKPKPPKAPKKDAKDNSTASTNSTESDEAAKDGGGTDPINTDDTDTEKKESETNAEGADTTVGADADKKGDDKKAENDKVEDDKADGVDGDETATEKEASEHDEL